MYIKKNYIKIFFNELHHDKFHIQSKINCMTYLYHVNYDNFSNILGSI
jgi:hypothetical protein